MRMRGGYGYTAGFPMERCYRDGAYLPVTPMGNDDERCRLATSLAQSV
jgi:alkylation response protein AidB-like acyl-CoA dehydrogenase